MSQALSYEEYLAGLPVDRRAAIETVWRVVRENMPAGYTEEIGAKFLSFKADEEWYVSLANQKNYVSLYLIPLYVYPELKTKLDESDGGRKLKCGKSCINFQRADDLPLEVIGEIVGTHGAAEFKEHMRRIRSEGSGKKKARKK